MLLCWLSLGGDRFGEGGQVEAREPGWEECGIQTGVGVPAGSLGVPLTTRQSGEPLLVEGMQNSKR